MVAASVAKVKKSMSDRLRSTPDSIRGELWGGIGRQRDVRMTNQTAGSRMTTETNLETYQRILETFNREGIDGVMPYFTDDVEVYDPDLPPGPYRGPERVRWVVEQMMSGFENVEIRDFRLLPAGDRVVSLLHTWARGGPDEIEIEARTAHT